MSAPKTVTLVDPQGGEVLVSHPADVNVLVYGKGYKVKGDQTPDQAIAFLGEKGVVADEQQLAVAAQPVETKTAK